MFVDSYKIEIMLETHQGKRRKEIHGGMSLTDYEILYGTITDKIVSIHMTLEPNIGGYQNGHNQNIK